MGLGSAVILPRLCVYFAPVPPQTLYLASMLIKALWNNALAAKAQLSKQSSFASLLNTNIPMGNKKGVSGQSPKRLIRVLLPVFTASDFHTHSKTRLLIPYL